MKDGTSCVLVWAICHTKSAALHPSSFNSHHNQPTAPRCSELCVFRSVFAQDSTEVMSTASWIPLKHGKSFVYSLHVHVHITQIRIELDSSPCLSTCSILLQASSRLCGLSCESSLHAARWRPKDQEVLTTFSHRTGEGQRKVQTLLGCRQTMGARHLEDRKWQ